jgi:tripartite-type tricarboxylate transporter receptor subunit TctC
MAPSGTPTLVIAQLNTEIAEVFKQPRFTQFLESQAAEPATGRAQAFATFLKADRQWTENLLRTANR